MRFNDFEDDWEIKKLDDLSKIQRGASPRPISSKKWYDKTNKNVGWVRIGDVTKSSKYLSETEDYFSEEGIKKSRFLPKGSLIMSICATIGKPIITDIDTCIHDGFVGFSELNINKEFLYYYLNILEPKFCSLSQTGSQANLNSDLVRISKIGVPSLKEQEKIVNFLSAVDKKIELLKEKYQHHQNFKKYLMQQIFAQKLRFDFEGEWEPKRLGDIVELMRNGTNETQVSFETSFPVTRIETISKGIINYDKVGYVENIDEDYKLLDGDILLSNINSLKYIGNLVYFDDNKTLYHGMNLMLLRFKDKFNKKFLYYFMKYHQQWFQMMACQAVNQASINQTSLKKFPFLIPKDIEEQNKIVNILDLTTNKINSLEDQIFEMKEFKKGLLQQMLI